MKTLLATLKAHISGKTVTPAWYWKVTRSDGMIYGFTSHVSDLLIAGVLFKSGAGFVATDIAGTDSLSVDNLEINGVISTDVITLDDVRAGKWDSATIEIGYVNYNDLTMGTSLQFVGTVGNITTGRLSFMAEQRGLTQPLQQNLGHNVSDQCHYVLGEASDAAGNPNCNVDLTPFIRTGTIGSVTLNRRFVDAARTEADHWWRGGNCTITSGASLGQKKAIKESLSDGTIALIDPYWLGIAPGDTYSMTPGCNHLLRLPDGSYGGDCKVKYNNVLWYPGFVRVPGQDKISTYAGAGGAV